MVHSNKTNHQFYQSMQFTCQLGNRNVTLSHKNNNNDNILTWQFNAPKSTTSCTQFDIYKVTSKQT